MEAGCVPGGEEACAAIAKPRVGTDVGLSVFLLGDARLVLAGLLTQLGDLWFILALLTALHWSGVGLEGSGGFHRRRAVSLIGLALAVFSTVLVCKVLVGAPRPAGAGMPETLPAVLAPAWDAATGVDSPSFPSGHAALSTAVYLALAHHLDRPRPTGRWIGAGLLVLLVGWTRVALEVHYVSDVLAGIALGLGLLLGFELIASRRPLVAFATGVLASLGAGALATDPDAMWVLGVCLGGLVAWVINDGKAAVVPVVPAAVVGTVIVGLAGPAYLVGAPTPIALGIGAIAGGLIVGLPSLTDGGSSWGRRYFDGFILTSEGEEDTQ